MEKLSDAARMNGASPLLLRSDKMPAKKYLVSFQTKTLQQWPEGLTL